MCPDRVSNPGPLTYESGALPTALRGPALKTGDPLIKVTTCSTVSVYQIKIHPNLLISQSKFSDPRKFTLRYHIRGYF